jgi:hypothetical protein
LANTIPIEAGPSIPPGIGFGVATLEATVTLSLTNTFNNFDKFKVGIAFKIALALL